MEKSDGDPGRQPSQAHERWHPAGEVREKELRWYHDNFNTPDDLSVWPPELGGGVNNA